MGDLVEVELARKQDTEQIHKLMVEYIVDFYKRDNPNDKDLKKLIEELQEQSIGVQYVARKGTEVVGFATVYFSYSTLQVKQMAILNDLYVVPSARGEKFGERLFQACLTYIRKHDMAYMTWETAKDNTTAQALYKKMGGTISDWLVYEIS